jgi:replicative DNA helicase/Fe2+ or Zn2+ uptake regulation protein
MSLDRTQREHKTTDPLLDNGPPTNVEAERSILGAILLDNAVCNQAIGLLRLNDFFLGSHRRIFDKMIALNKRSSPIDLITLMDELRRAGEFEQIGGATYIASLIDGVPRTDTIEHHAKIVRICALERALIRLSNQLVAVSVSNEEEDIARRGNLLQQYEEVNDKLNALMLSTGSIQDIRDRIISADELMALEFAEPRFAVDGILQEGANVLAGRPKTGKSKFALSIAVAVASGGKALGKIEVEGGSVLYLGLEDGLRRLKKRLIQLLSKDKIPKDLYFKTRWRKLDQGGIQDLRAWMHAHPDTRLIVIDTIKRVRPNERRGARIYDLDYEAVALIAEFAEQSGVCVLIITHTNKRETASLEDPFDAISGSTGLTGAADAMLVLKRERGKHDAALHITGRDIEERELALQSDPLIGSWLLLGDVEEYRLSEQRSKILNVIKESFEPLGPKDVFEILQKSNVKMGYDAVRQLMHRMASDGQLKADGCGKYTICSHSHHSVTDSTTVTMPQARCGAAISGSDTDVLTAECDTVTDVTGMENQGHRKKRKVWSNAKLERKD